MRHWVRHSVAAAALATLSAGASAQVFEEMELRREGNDAVVVMKFATPVQFRGAVSARAGDLTQIYYDLIPLTDLPGLLGSARRMPARGDLPQLDVRDEIVGRSGMSRKLVVNFGVPTKFGVRAGRSNRHVEIVLTGLGDAATRSFEPIPPGTAVPGVAAAAPDLPVAPPAEPATTPPSPQPGEALQPQSSEDVNRRAVALLAAAQIAFDRGDFGGAIERLNVLLALPPNSSSRKAQELIGMARLRRGEIAPTRAEFELFLKLYPSGEDSERVRQALASLPASPAVKSTKPAVEASSVWSGSVSAFYYGGQSKVRSQEFQDSPISGLPQLMSENTISGIDQSQVQTSVDLNWRYRDADSDMRFVFRDPLAIDLRPDGVNKNRLSTLFFDRRSLVNGTSFRIGRQSPVGAGVLYRFDGIQAGYQFAPKWRINGMVGVPTEQLLDTKRRIYGVWIDSEALTQEISGNLYFNQQTIDGQIDRRAIGTEMRYFSGGLSASAQFDYDIALKSTNIAAVQATWQLPDTTVINALYDYRATPILSLGNILFFQDPSVITPARRMQDLLGITSLAALRDQVTGVTAYQTQAMLGVTTPIAKNWQMGGDIRLTNVGEVKPVAIILPNGSPSTGNLWGMGVQLIGSNLYSSRDTHVLNASYMRGPTYNGTLLSYNNLSTLTDKWQLEPSLKYYRQNDSSGASSERWTPGLRVTYRVLQQVTLETELTYEMSTLNAPSRSESSNRMFYYLGVRYDF